jgi:predicted ATPase
LLRLDVARLLAPSYSDQPVPHMEPNGEGLPSVLAYLASNRPEQFARIREALRAVVPIVRDMRFPRAAVIRFESEVIKVDDKTFTHRAEREYWGNSIEFDMEGAPRIPAEMVSEGTLLVLGLLTMIMGPERPRIVLLDDIDRALHPKAQGDLVALLRRLLDQNPDMQIVATSHSPYLLDHLRPEEVRLTTLKDDGSVACGRLDQHPEFEKWKETMTPGEFWSLVGEKWLVEAEAGDAGS